MLTSWMNIRRAAGSVGTLDAGILVDGSSDSLSSKDFCLCGGINCSGACAVTDGDI